MNLLKWKNFIQVFLFVLSFFRSQHLWDILNDKHLLHLVKDETNRIVFRKSFVTNAIVLLAPYPPSCFDLLGKLMSKSKVTVCS